MNFGKVLWYHQFPGAFVEARVAQRAAYFANNPNGGELPAFRVGVGRLEDLEDRSKLYAFYETGFASGAIVAYDLADGNAAQYATRVRRALRVPSFVNGRIVSWKVVEWNNDLAARITKALAGRAAEGYQPQRTCLPWKG